MTSQVLVSSGDWNQRERAESQTQRLDRNWMCLLGELRVVLTGVQLLTAFLLILPFQQRFTILGSELMPVYLSTVAGSIAATILFTTPVALHRLLFRRHLLVRLVQLSHWFTVCGIIVLGATLSGVAMMVFAVTAGWAAGIAAASAAALAWLALWVALPLVARRGTPADVLA
jgi:hypothetical protein